MERLPLTGENIYRSSMAADPALATLLEGADLLAERVGDWPLYDPARRAANTVPVVACVYERDVYVDPGLSRATAKVTGGVTVVDDEVHHQVRRRRAGLAAAAAWRRRCAPRLPKKKTVRSPGGPSRAGG